MQLSKANGGIAFRDLEKFNDAFLAKQAWRILRHPSTLLARLMKARYFKDTSILNARTRINQSHGWISILTGLNLIKKGMRHITGDGDTIRIFHDNWLPTKPSRPTIGNVQNTNLFVKDLVTNTGNNKIWDQEKINHLLSDEDQSLVSHIYLSQTQKKDRIIWSYENTGKYTIKSGY